MGVGVRTGIRVFVEAGVKEDVAVGVHIGADDGRKAAVGTEVCGVVEIAPGVAVGDTGTLVDVEAIATGVDIVSTVALTTGGVGVDTTHPARPMMRTSTAKPAMSVPFNLTFYLLSRLGGGWF